MLLTTLYFFLALLILIIVHEYGHFQVARWCGVKVLRFSFGFGKILAHWYDKKGTEYAFSLVPLGGYIKMLGESKEPVAVDEQHRSFNHQSVWVRMAIVLAGPLFNFIFAFIALWLTLVIGMHSLAPIIQSVKPDSLAAKAHILPNQELIGFNGKKINSWRSFQYALMPYIGSQESISLTFKSLNDGHQSQVFLPLKAWNLDYKNPDLLKSLGIEPFIPAIPPLIGEVIPGTPAASVDLKVNDRVLSVDGQAVTDWLFLVNYVKAHPDTPLQLKLSRQGQIRDVILKTGRKENQGSIEGFIGLNSQKIDWPKQWLRLEREKAIPAISTAFHETLELSSATFILMGRLVSGQLGFKSISGPLGIAKGAGSSGRNGLVSYLFFLSIVSISLGALNLLPIPLLDGGHLLYYVLEIIRGKPISERAKNRGITIGFLLLAALMIVAFTNDILRIME